MAYKFDRTATNPHYGNPAVNRHPKSKFMSDAEFEKYSTECLIKHHVLIQEFGAVELVMDKERQVQGIDVICDIPFKDHVEEHMYVDIKAIASKLPTFAFEVAGNVHSGQVGWFIKEGLLTDYYLVVYQDIVNGQGYLKNKDVLNYENVNYTKCLLIRKEKLQRYVLDYFNLQSIQDLQTVVEDIRVMSDGCKTTEYYTTDGENTRSMYKEDTRNHNMWFTVSGAIYEKPINVVIREGILEGIADKVVELDEDGKPLYQAPSREEELLREFYGEKFIYEMKKNGQLLS